MLLRVVTVLAMSTMGLDVVESECEVLEEVMGHSRVEGREGSIEWAGVGRLRRFTCRLGG
jgi:hypothetical protein